MTTSNFYIVLEIPDTLAGKRLDQALSTLVPQYSRARLQNWIKAGYVTIDGAAATSPRLKVMAKQVIAINAAIEDQETALPQKIGLDIVYEDNDIIVINKPAGLVVHPGAGCKEGTLLNALLYHAPELAKLPRAGIIHRLDKNTSGLLVITRNLPAHTKLVADLQERKVKREYETVVYGQIISGGTIETQIGRHKTQRTKMAVTENGKLAITHYRLIQRFNQYTHLRVILETGRTHQIRVHMSHINHPIVGDTVYGGRLKLAQNTTSELREFLCHFKRQALHAVKLSFMHPGSKKEVQFSAPLAQDIQELLRLIQAQNPQDI